MTTCVRVSLRLLLAVAALGGCGGRDPQAHFAEVTAGITPADSPALHVPGSGATVLDYDNDGRLDLFVPCGGPYLGRRNALLHNLGGNRFVDVAVAAGLQAEGRFAAASAADYDNDGFVDLFVTGIETIHDGKASFDAPRILYHNNGDGTFRDVTAAAGLRNGETGYQSNWADLDGDGWLDLFVATVPDVDVFRPYPDPDFPANLVPARVYRNNRDGTFTDMTGDWLDHKGPSFGSVLYDADEDGAVDLLIADDTHHIFGFKNDGSGHFTDVSAAAGFDQIGDWMGFALFDYDGDGRIDYFCTNNGSSTFFEPHEFAPGANVPGGNELHALYRNLGGFRFANTAGTVKVDTTYFPHPKPGKDILPLPAGLSGLQIFEGAWGTVSFDYDNDGWEDFYFVGTFDSGFNTGPIGSIDNGANPGRLLRNDGHGGFAELGREAGVWNVDDTGFILQSFGVATGDFDNNGFDDLVIVNQQGPSVVGGVRIFANQGNGHHWVTLKLHGDGVHDNRDGIGARVWLDSAGRRQVREIVAGSSANSQNSIWAHFGLGRERTVDRVVVRWPSGRMQTVDHVAVDRFTDVEER